MITMASVVHLGLALLILTGSVVQVDSYFKHYISVVSDVHEYYGTSSVFFVLSRNNRSLEDYTSIHSLSRDFSRQYDFSSIIYFDQLDERTTWYHKRIGRSLLVISLRSMSDIAEFTKKSTSESYIWLVIFTNEFGNSAVCDYCNSPNGNSFQLRFDTELLVLCCDSLILKEWWSIDGKRTEVSDFAFWTSENSGKLIFLASAALETRRPDLKGAGIRIALVKNSAFAYEVGDEIKGLFGDILAELKRSMNFTISEIVRSSGFGHWNSATKNWTGFIGQLARGEADLGVSDITITKARLEVIEYTPPLAATKNALFYRDREDVTVHWTAYLKVFSVSTWIAVIVVIILAPILLAVIKVFKSSRPLPTLIVESYLNVWGIFCQQGLCEFPTVTSQRIAYFSIFILALVIYAYYSAALVSFITISASSSPFTTFEGFVNDGSYQLIIQKNTADYEFFANATVPVLKEMMKLMKPIEQLPETDAEAWQQICQEKVAFYTYDVSKTNCKVMAIDSGYEDTLAMAMPAGSQYRRVLNYHIQRFKDTGVIDRIKRKYHVSTYTSEGATFNEFKVLEIAPLLAALTVGIMVALLVLLGEMLYNSFQTNSRNSISFC